MAFDYLKRKVKKLDPYGETARRMDREPAEETDKKPEMRKPEAANKPPMKTVGKKYMDPQSQADEQYMTGAQQRTNERLAREAEYMSEEFRRKRGRFGTKRQ